MKNPLEHQNGKGSKPRPVKGDIYRSRFDEIFGKGKKEEKPKYELFEEMFNYLNHYESLSNRRTMGR